tara:strand:+ start:676 stop:897 length:222 start_codon:yes stop_codon:yes gene_type:complete
MQLVKIMEEEKTNSCMDDLKCEIERLRGMIKDLEARLMENVAEMTVFKSLKRDEDRSRPRHKAIAKNASERKK